ncbi:MAG: YncE family protein [Crocinitomicaceae bacterium]
MDSIKLPVIFVFGLVLISCKKDKPEPVTIEGFNNGIVVLCEGLFQQNNSSISWINKSNEAVSNGVFNVVNDRHLGDTGNDLLHYGSKIYVAVNASSTIEILDANTFKASNQVIMEAGGMAKQPRYLEGHNGKVYISCFDGFVDVLDTVTGTVLNRIAVGWNPDGMTQLNDYLYVSNSGGLNFPTMDSTVSVIDLNTDAELIKVTVGLNPGDIEASSNGNIYVISRGDYGAIPSKLVKIDPATFQTTDLLTDVLEINPFGPDEFLITYENAGGVSIGVFNAVSEQLTNADLINTANITTVYEAVFNEQDQLIYVLDAMGYSNTGYVRAYDVNGNFVKDYHVGLNPTDLIVLP